MRDKQFYADKNFQEKSEQEFLANRTWIENDYQILEDVALLQYHRAFSSLSDEGLKQLFSTLPSLTIDQIYKAVELFSEFPNGTYKYSYQNLFFETLMKKRHRLPLNSSIYTNGKTHRNQTFSLVGAVFDDFELDHAVDAQWTGDDEELVSTSTSSITDEDETDTSLNSYIYTNEKKGKKKTFRQVRGTKWKMQDDWYADESMIVQIERKCISAGLGDEDLVAEAIAIYWEMKVDGKIDYEKEPAYWVRAVVNRLIDKLRHDSAQKRKSVDTVSWIDPPYTDVTDEFGDYDQWYESLTKTQRAAVDDARYKVEKDQTIGTALRKRLSRVPRPVMGESVQRFGTTDLRETHAAMRPEIAPEPAEVVTTNKRPKAKRANATTLRQMIENGPQVIVSTQMPIPALTEKHREPETAGEGKDIPNEVQKPTGTNMSNLRTQWEELLLDQLGLDITTKELYAINYKLDKYADCLILSKEFEQSLRHLGIDADNYKEIHNKLCSDTKSETVEVA